MINIAIDGPSGAGKSTVAKIIANKKNILYLDTGAMYRAAALYALENNIDVCDENAVSYIVDAINIDIIFDNKIQRVYLNGKDVTDFLRNHSISKAASDISAHKCVRTKLVDIQRKIAAKRACVLDGRDIGTVVLPDANLKIYLTATPEARALRRYNELIKKGDEISYQKVYNDLVERDKNDSTRKESPLKKADDAIEIDSTQFTAEEIADKIIKILENLHG